MRTLRLNFSFITLLAVISLLSIVQCSQPTSKTNDWQRMNLKQQVLQIDEIRYSSYQQIIQKKKGEKSFTRFDNKGLITKNATYMNYGQIHWMKYLYTNDSVWISELRELENNSEHPQAYWLYKVNEKGQQYAITSYLLDTSINFHIDMTLNNDGNPLEINYSQQRYPTYVPCKIIKLYDETGKLKEEHTYQYDENTKKCSESYTRTIIILNEQGDLDREISYYPSGERKVHSYRYLYDKHGNWTEKQHYNGDIAEDVTLRTLTYFEDSTSVKK